MHMIELLMDIRTFNCLVGNLATVNENDARPWRMSFHPLYLLINGCKNDFNKQKMRKSERKKMLKLIKDKNLFYSFMFEENVLKTKQKMI